MKMLIFLSGILGPWMHVRGEGATAYQGMTARGSGEDELLTLRSVEDEPLALCSVEDRTSALRSVEDDTVYNDTVRAREIKELTVTARRSSTRRLGGASNGFIIDREELFKAACCNLGESFTTNPSVDVHYSDAATGAKQIRLLGLSGTYVQMLTENLPNLRGLASAYSLDYVPGPWMQSIQVSKGASSVRNGYESITGQIDVEYLKPDADEGVTVNLFGNTMQRVEANADANVHLREGVSSEILVHYQDAFHDDDINHDGFADDPSIRQYHLQNRWKIQGTRHLTHVGIGLLNERREGGQTAHLLHRPDGFLHGADSQSGYGLYTIGTDNKRYEGYLKHAWVIAPEHGTNVALMANASLHETDAHYGHKTYDAEERTAYGQLMFETHWGDTHELSAGLSLQHDYLHQRVSVATGAAVREKETTAGGYVQYTYTMASGLTAMAGLRADHSSAYGTFVTPRLHLKYMPTEHATLRLSAGKGYRSVHALAEHNYLLGSGRSLHIADLHQEEAWNAGVNGAFTLPLGGRNLKLNAEYYYTRFNEQAVIDYDSHPGEISIGNLDGRSYSHTVQIDATYPVATGLEVTAAYRLNDVKTSYGGTLRAKPLTSRYKALLSASYKTPLGLWQADATLQLNGGGRLPVSYAEADGSPSWPSHFSAFEQLHLQVTRWFRHFSVYVGGENLTGKRQKTPIIHAEAPWSAAFDPTMVWGPVSGAAGYIGIRMNIGKL